MGTLSLEAVTETSDALDPIGGFLQLFAKSFDVRVDCSSISEVPGAEL
jgi:hypothetical protein